MWTSFSFTVRTNLNENFRIITFEHFTLTVGRLRILHNETLLCLMQPTADCVRLPLLLQVRQPTRLLQQQVCGNSKVNNKSLLRVSTGRGSLHSSRPVCANSTKSFRVLETSCRRRDPRTTPSMWSVTSRHGVNLSCRTQNRQCP